MRRLPRLALSLGISVAIAAVFVAVWTPSGFAVSGASAQGVPVGSAGVGTPPDDPGRGLVYSGLVAHSGGIDAPGLARACEHGFALTVRGETLCTHGPDPAPTGVDVRAKRSTREIVAATAASTSSATTTAAVGPAVPCYADGTSGRRVQAIYVRSADVTDRFDSLSPSMAQWATNNDLVYANSAAKLGGIRHLRYVTDAACNLVVARAQLSSTGDDTFSNTIAELQQQGFNRTDRKYLLWVDANVYCGIGNVRSDDRNISTNANDNGPSYSRVDAGCWGSASSVEAHELMHNIGGVQLSAPHTSGGWHCTDESDRMCYSDASGVTMNYVCPSDQEKLFDCHDDDYFSVAPVAGSYLETHWNTAMSAFLERVAPPAWGAGVSGTGGSPTTTSPTTTIVTTTTAAPTTIVTTTTAATSTTIATTTTLPTMSVVTFGGSLNRNASTRSFDLATNDGTMMVELSFTKARSLSLKVTNSSGATVAEGTGPSVLRLSPTVAAGIQRLTVSGSGNANFTLKVTYRTP